MDKLYLKLSNVDINSNKLNIKLKFLNIFFFV